MIWLWTISSKCNFHHHFHSTYIWTEFSRRIDSVWFMVLVEDMYKMIVVWRLHGLDCYLLILEVISLFSVYLLYFAAIGMRTTWPKVSISVSCLNVMLLQSNTTKLQVILSYIGWLRAMQCKVMLSYYIYVRLYTTLKIIISNALN